MSKKVLIQQIQPDPDGPVFGEVSNPADFVKSEIFAHEHTEQVTEDYLSGGGCGEAPEVAGLDHLLTGGMGIRLIAPGRVYDGGLAYEFLDTAIDFTISAADSQHARIDLIYATFSEDVESEAELRPFVRLRTQAELDANAPPYAPQQFTQPTELHNVIAIALRAGTPSSAPELPELQVGEIALYSVTVNAGASALGTADVNDLRDRVRSLRCAWKEIDSIESEIDEMKAAKHRHPANEVDIGAGAGRFTGLTDQAAWNLLGNQSDDSSFDPLTRPEILTPELVPSNSESGKLGSVGAVDGTTAVVDIPVGRRIAFSNVIRTLEPSAFPASANARLVNKHVNAGTQTQTNTIPFSMSTIDAIESDGGGDWALLGAVLPSSRYCWPGGRFAAARDDRYIEVMGGLPGGGTDWYTFDSLAESFTQRVFTGDVPVNPIVFVIGCSNGQMLFATQGNTGAWEWFLLNTATGAATKFNSGAPDTAGATMAWGAVVQANVVFLCVSSSVNRFWIYHADSNTFENFVPVGQGPLFATGQPIPLMDICFYQPGQAVVYQTQGFSGQDNADHRATIIFDYATRTFTTLNINTPFSGGRARLAMTNVNGRAYVLNGSGGRLPGYIFELTPGINPQWKQLSTSLPMRHFPGVASLFSNGLPQGNGFFFGGQDPVSFAAKSDVWRFGAGGIIETLCGGVPGITLGPGATQASFRVANFALDWQCAKLIANLQGTIPPGSVRLSYSLDGGATFQDVTRDVITTVLSSSNPGTRVLKITLIGSGSSKPCLNSLYEQFEKVGGPGFSQLVLRYDHPLPTLNVVRALFIDRAGVVTIENAVAETTPDKCLLHKAIGQGSGQAPLLTDYINKRSIYRKYTGTKAGGSDPSFLSYLPVKPALIEAFKVAASGAMSNLADPTVTFDAAVVVTGLADTDSYRVVLTA